MNLINTETKEIIDSKALAERVECAEDTIKRKVRKAQPIEDAIWERVPEDAMVSAEKTEEEPFNYTPLGEGEYTLYDWVPVLEVTSEWGNIVVEKQPFSGAIQSKVDMSLYEHYNWDFKYIDELLKKITDKAKTIKLQAKEE